jgi:ABC-type phosphate transport system permease subunit
LVVYKQATSPFNVAVTRAWGAALVLIVFVLILSVIARLVTRRNRLV